MDVKIKKIKNSKVIYKSIIYLKKNWMRRFVYIFLFFSALSFGQINSNNRFSQSEYQTEKPQDNLAAAKSNTDPAGKPGNPGPPLPIHREGFLLFLIAVGIIVLSCKNYKKFYFTKN